MAKDQDALKMYLLDVQGFSQRNGVFQGNILNAMSFQHTSGYRIFNPPADTCTNYSSRENNDSRYFCTYFCKSNRQGSNSYKSKLNEWHVNVAGWVKIKDVWTFFSHTVCYELLHIAVWLEAQSGISTLTIMRILYLMCLFI